MSDQQDVPQPEETPNPFVRRRRRWHWLLAFVVLVGGSYFILGRGGEAPAPAQDVPPEMQVTPPAPVTAPETPNADGAATTPAEPPTRAAASTEEDPLADPLAPIESADLNQVPPAPTPTEEEMPAPPPPVESAPPPPPPMPAVSAEPEPAPAPKPARQKKKKAEEKKKSYKLVFSKSGTKVPSGLKKDKVLKFLAKKLDGDKSCLPKSMAKKDAKPFVAIVNVSKTGAVTAVTTQPKLADSKKISACIKKKLAGSPGTFKGKGKASARISVSLKMAH